MPTITLVVSGHTGLGDKDSLCKQAWYSVVITTSLEDLDFAGDLALLSHRIQDMRDKTQALEEQSAKVGLKINATKTKLMRVGTKQGDGVMIAGEQIEEVDEFKYLGSIVSRKGGTEEDIQPRIGKARQVFAMLRPIWRSTSLTTGTKLSVFGSTVKAVLLYGAETWRLTKELKQKFQVFINKCLRSILPIWWPRRIRNDELWRQTGQRTIEEEIKERSWRWIGHTLRRTDGMWPRQPSNGTHSGRAREGDTDTLGDALGCSNVGREDLRGVRQKQLPKIELGGEY